MSPAGVVPTGEDDMSSGSAVQMRRGPNGNSGTGNGVL